HTTRFRSMSLIDTGWTLSVGDVLAARTSTSGITKVSAMSINTRATSSACTVNSEESLGMNPARVARMMERPGGTSGNVTRPAPSVIVFASTVVSDDRRSSTSTPDKCTLPWSVVTGTTTRAGRADLGARIPLGGKALAGVEQHARQNRTAGSFGIS